ncbi:MAG: NAD(P)H-dependent oxidoreductase [Bacteroidetes bacterium]|nr:NAD(P)H-dependent oxidoreductase [Bacteroidota bacterium]
MNLSIILGSARNDGNTRKVIDQLFKDKDFQFLPLSENAILQYDYDHEYPDYDEFMSIMENLIPNTDIFLFATPVYWYSMSGHTKVFLDRITDLLKINKPLGRQLRGKKMAMLSCSNGNDRPEGFEIPFRFSAEYLGMDYLGDAHFWWEEDQLQGAPKALDSLFSIMD